MALFDASYDKLDGLLKGKIVRSGSRVFTVTEARGYPKDENDRGIYKPITEMAPGDVYCPRRRNAILFLIACRDGRGKGGCVLIRNLLSPKGGAIDGPAAVSAALGVSEPKTTGKVVELPNGELRVELDGVLSGDMPEYAETMPRGPAGIGEKTLKKHSAKVAAAYSRYLKAHPGIRFADFLASLVSECQTEAALLEKLKKI
jgi:hypothetical protein